jgi:hydrogenase-4 component B
MAFIQFFIFILVLSGFLIAVSPMMYKGMVSIMSVVILATITSVLSIRVLIGNPIELILSGSLVTEAIPIILDPLSAWFILVINFTFVTGAFYGHYYLKAYQMPSANVSMHWISFILAYASLTVICVIQNLFVFLIAWEIMALSAFFLVIFEGFKNKTLKAGINYLIQSHLVILFLTLAFIWVYTTTHSLKFEAIAQFSADAKPFRSFFLMMLLLIGFGTKAGFVPFHTWLPHAHPAAPSHISGIMSGVLVKIGIYGIIRSLSFIRQDFEIIGVAIILLSMVTGFFGIINAALHRDFKRMLAYCTIENIGILGLGLGLGVMGLAYENQVLIFLGFGSALLHTLNHSLIKSLLFYSAGSVYQQTHTRDMEKLGGLIKTMPKTAFLFLIGALAIGGLPPFNAFVSEFMLYLGLLKGVQLPGYFATIIMISSVAALAVIGGISIYAFTKLFGVIFLGTPKSQLSNKPQEVSLGMRLPQYFILLAMLTVVVFPAFYFTVLKKVVSLSFPLDQPFEMLGINEMGHNIQWVGLSSLLFIALAGTVYAIRNYLTKIQTEEMSPTWGCGYATPNARMQYTGKSFSKAMAKLLSFIVPEKKKYLELKTAEIFPAKRTHSTSYSDFFERIFIDTGIRWLQNFLNRFQFIQNGKLQRYILFGLFFIIAIFIGLVISLVHGIFS